MQNKNKIILGISCGDINGIGLEIILKAFSHSNLFDFCTPILYAPLAAVNFYKTLYNYTNFNYHVITDTTQNSQKQLNLIKMFNAHVEITPGENTKLAAEIALQSLELMIEDYKKKKIDAVLTLPVNKQNISLLKTDFLGHTDYLLQKLNKKENAMFLCAENLRVATLTNHIPISEISSHITETILIDKINIIAQSLKEDFLIIKPKIAVLGLNPHAGDNGLIGKEEEEVIAPTVKKMFDAGQLVFGPYSADAFFGTGSYNKFDAVIAIYHDQGLIPFKSLSFGSGVNFTAGLPMIRVSPDHGVAYDIAGKGIADAGSCVSAIFLAHSIYKNRLTYFGNIRKND
mgnify:CR=1 FL=1